MYKKAIFLSLSFLLILSAVASAQIAFPGAEGAGRYAAGGRGGRIVEVTNLNDSGTGSLRWALDNEHGNTPPKIIVFRVSGTINLTTGSLSIVGYNQGPAYTTIAGQTAPGDGITLKNGILVTSSSEIIVRYIRVRSGTGAGHDSDGFTIGSGSNNVIIDHVSTSWGMDEVFSFPQSGSDTIQNITAQWCTITEGLNHSIHSKGEHSKGTLLYGAYGHKFSFHHNIYAHNIDRNPRLAGGINAGFPTYDTLGLFCDFRNNVVYNWGGSYAGHDPGTGTAKSINFVGNYYKRGVNSSANSAPWEEHSLYSKGYFNDNWLDGNCPSDPWSLVRFVGLPDANIAAYKQPSEINIAPMPTDDALTAYNKVLAGAGCTVPYRDSVDRQIVSDIENGTGQVIDCVDANSFYYPIAMARAGTANTLTLAANDYHANRDAGGGALVGYVISIRNGTGAGQTRTITIHDTTTKVVTVSPNWDTIPDTTSQYGILIDCTKNAGGWPVLRNGTPPMDSDHDGMPDKWETARGLNPNNAADGSLVAASGYTNVEDYLNYMAVRNTVLPADLNGDGQVDNDDLAIFVGEWLNNDCNNIPYGDMNNDCNVDFSDFAVLADSWLKVYGQ